MVSKEMSETQEKLKTSLSLAKKIAKLKAVHKWLVTSDGPTLLFTKALL